MPGPDESESFQPDPSTVEYPSTRIAVTDPQGNIAGYRQYREGPVERDQVTGRFQRTAGTFEVAPIDPRTGKPNRDLKPSRIARFSGYLARKHEERLAKLDEKRAELEKKLAQQQSIATKEASIAQLRAAQAAARTQARANNPFLKGAKKLAAGTAALAKRGLFDYEQQPSDPMLVGSGERRRVIDVSRVSGSTQSPGQVLEPDEDDPVEEEVEDMLGLGSLSDIIGGGGGGEGPPSRRRRSSSREDFGGLF